MKFKGFYGEDIRILKRKDFTEDHDHLFLNINGKDVGYFHIDSEDVSLFDSFKGNEISPKLNDLRTR